MVVDETVVEVVVVVVVVLTLVVVVLVLSHVLHSAGQFARALSPKLPSRSHKLTGSSPLTPISSLPDPDPDSIPPTYPATNSLHPSGSGCPLHTNVVVVVVVAVTDVDVLVVFVAVVVVLDVPVDVVAVVDVEVIEVVVKVDVVSLQSLHRIGQSSRAFLPTNGS